MFFLNNIGDYYTMDSVYPKLLNIYRLFYILNEI